VSSEDSRWERASIPWNRGDLGCRDVEVRWLILWSPRAGVGQAGACPRFLPEGSQRLGGHGHAGRRVARSAMRSTLEA
jgi:hypothetical protein